MKNQIFCPQLWQRVWVVCVAGWLLRDHPSRGEGNARGPRALLHARPAIAAAKCRADQSTASRGSSSRWQRVGIFSSTVHFFWNFMINPNQQQQIGLQVQQKQQHSSASLLLCTRASSTVGEMQISYLEIEVRDGDRSERSDRCTGK